MSEIPVTDYSLSKYSAAQDKICVGYSDSSKPEKAKEVGNDAIQSLISLNTYNCNYDWSYIHQGSDWKCMCLHGLY